MKRTLTVRAPMSPIDANQAAAPRNGQAEGMARRSVMRRQIALLAALFLFAQLALASQGCAVAPADNAHDGPMGAPPCANVPMDSGVCFTHCVTPDESVATPDQHFTAIATSPAVKPLDLTLSANRDRVHALCDARLHVPRSLQILYCSYQT